MKKVWMRNNDKVSRVIKVSIIISSGWHDSDEALMEFKWSIFFIRHLVLWNFDSFFQVEGEEGENEDKKDGKEKECEDEEKEGGDNQTKWRELEYGEEEV